MSARPVILCRPVSAVHVRNLGLLAGALESAAQDADAAPRLRALHDPAPPWFAPARTDGVPAEFLAMPADRVPEAAWQGDVRLVLPATCQPVPRTLALLAEAAARRVPTLAVQEVHQLTLLGGRVNNYLLPVDHLLAASPAERDGLVAAGAPAERTEATGWPFWAGLERGTGDRAEARRALDLPADAGIAVVTLSLHADRDAAGPEGDAERARVLETAAAGLPENWILLVKPHPSEAADAVAEAVGRHAPQARVVSPEAHIDQVLDAADVLVNHGGSQTVIEALLRGTGVVLARIPGRATLFDGVADDLVVEARGSTCAAEMRAALERARRDGAGPRAVAAHVGVDPADALRQLAERALAAAAGGEGARRPDAETLPRLLLWAAATPGAGPVTARLATLVGERLPDDPAGCAALALVSTALPAPATGRGPSPDFDPGPLAALAPDPAVDAARALRVRDLVAADAAPGPEDLEFVAPLPGPMTVPYFLADAVAWGRHLLRHGHGRRVRNLCDRLEALAAERPGLRAAPIRTLRGRADAGSLRPTGAAFGWLSAAVGRRLRERMRPRVTLLNDTADEPNWGCAATVAGLRRRAEDALGPCAWRTRPPRFAHPGERRDLPDEPDEFDDWWRDGRGHGPTLRDLRWAGHVILNGEGSLHDARPRDERPEPWERLLEVYAAARVVGRPTAAVNMTVHARTEQYGRWLRTALGACDHVSVREPRSLRRLHDLGVDRAVLVPDAAFLVTPDPPARADSLLTERGVTDPFAAVFLGETAARLPAAATADLVTGVEEATGAPAVLFAGPPVDIERLAELSAAGVRRPVIAADVSPGAVVALLRRARVVVSGRYHCSLFAYTAGAPLVAMGSNTDKMEGLLEVLERDDPVHDPADISAVVEAAGRVAGEGDAERDARLGAAARAAAECRAGLLAGLGATW